MDLPQKMPSVDAKRQTVRHRRHLTRATTIAPTSLNSLVIPDAFKQTTDGRQFLLHDSGADRIIIYATEANLEEMVDSRHWFMDGTFKTMPPQHIAHSVRHSDFRHFHCRLSDLSTFWLRHCDCRHFHCRHFDSEPLIRRCLWPTKFVC